MRILFVLENYLPHIGGAEVVFKSLAEELVKTGFSVDLVTHRLKHTKSFEVINGVHVHRVRCFDSRYLFTFFSILKVVQLVRKADVIHTTTFNGAPPAWLASKLTGKKCILTVHEVWVGKWRQLIDKGFISAFFHNFLEKIIYLLPFDAYACVSKNTQRDLIKMRIPQDKAHVVYNGVDYEHFDPKKYNGKRIREKLNFHKEFVYLYYGRPGPSKGVEYLVRAVPQIVQTLPQSKLLLVLSKDAAYRARYNSIVQLIKKLMMENHVILHNPVPWSELPAYVKAADCVVVPSLAEGFGFSAAESCAMGKAVVATYAGSLPEVVSGKYVLVDPKSASALAQGIIDVYHGKVSIAPLKKFELERNIQLYIELYNLVKK